MPIWSSKKNKICSSAISLMKKWKHLPIMAEAERTLLGIIALPGSQFAEPSERGAKRKVPGGTHVRTTRNASGTSLADIRECAALLGVSRTSASLRAEMSRVPRAGDGTRLTRNHNLNKSETLFLVSLRLAPRGSG